MATVHLCPEYIVSFYMGLAVLDDEMAKGQISSRHDTHASIFSSDHSDVSFRLIYYTDVHMLRRICLSLED